MNILFYFYSCFNPNFMGMLLDEAVELSKNKNNQVKFVICGGINNMCLFNSGGSKPTCKLCTSCTASLLKQYGIEAIYLKDYLISNNYCIPQVSTSEDIRALTYRNVNIGLSIMSNYISSTRNLDPLIDDESRPYFCAHIEQNYRFVDALYNVIEDFNPDRIYSFNGRFEEVRPLFDISKTKHIELYLSEGITQDGVWKKLFFINKLPHDVRYNMELREYCWDHYNMTEEEKKQFGKSFYEKRRNGIYAGDKIYIKDQKKGVIPPIDKSKINIAIMNSSEDEYAAVGAEWESLKFFKSQYDGIIYLLENSDSRIHYFLRIHPNLKDIRYKYHTDLLTLENRYSNITVIPGNSEVSSYSLMDEMDKIICFGSTMGIESAYWGKPVILLGPAQYTYDEVCYKPKDNAELNDLLLTDLKPLFNDSIIKYGAYFINQEPLFAKQYSIDFTINSEKFMGLSYHTTPYISFIINSKITNFLIAIGRYIAGLGVFCKYTVPLKEA